jgi:5-(carboxyamino)imidazole ribonucleotide synthase
VSTVGILGGGQLARMLALAGLPLGLRFRVFDPDPSACAGQVAPLTVADYADPTALEAFARSVDVVTFDFENVPADAARAVAAWAPVFPGPEALEVAQDRLAEKTLFNALGLATPAFAPVASRADLDAALERIGTPSVLKTRRLGYDGKGQFRLRAVADADAAWRALGGSPLILERFVPFEREVSVVAVRGRDGDFRAWPLTRNWHADGILSVSLAPDPEAADLADEASAIAKRLADRLAYVGVFALELFVERGRLLGNEMAPRVHNSGHWTIEGAETSQFENHLRAVVGWPLGSTTLRAPTAMVNLIGALPDRRVALREPGLHWHDYGKSPRAGRKVGHATISAPSMPALCTALERAGAALAREAEVAPALAALARALA